MVVVVMAATLTLVMACGGSEDSSPTNTTVPATQGSGGGEFDDPTEQFDQELLAQGKVIFDKTAGGIGCAYCHGLDGKGIGPVGTGAPPNRGLGKDRFDAAIEYGATRAMEFLGGKLSSSETQAVLEYTAWLDTQP